MKNLKIIGYVESCYIDKFGTPRQPGLVSSSFAKITLSPEVQPEESLQGLEDFSHIWVLFHFHQNANKRFHAKVHPPRLLGKTKGVFATRSPHRPNPIGLSLLKLEKVEASTIYVSGIDLVDGTPVLDIKPYLPQVEAVPEASPGWSENVENQEISITFSHEALNSLMQMESDHPAVNVQALIEDTLKLDPRPVVYRGFEGADGSPYRSQHAIRLMGYDIHFCFEKTDFIKVLKIMIVIPE